MCTWLSHLLSFASCLLTGYKKFRNSPVVTVPVSIQHSELDSCRCFVLLFHLSKFLSMITFRPRSAREVAFQTFRFAGAPASTCKKPWIGDLFHLHLLHKLAVVRLLQVCLQVESATDSGVRDDRGEYLRAVDLLSPPPALAKHVS